MDAALVDGQKKALDIPCPLILTQIPTAKNRGYVTLDTATYKTVTIVARYELNGVTFVYGDVKLTISVAPDAAWENRLPFSEAVAKAPQGVLGDLSVSFPASLGNRTQNAAASITFSFDRADSTQHIKLHSIIVLNHSGTD